MRSIVNAPEAEGLNEGVILGLDIGGTKTALLAWDCAPQTVLTQDAVSTPTENGPDVAIERLGEASEHLLTGCVRSLGDLRAIGVAVPGLVDAAAGQVLTAGNLDGWVDLPLADRLVARCTVPVATEHDANAVALGERWRGAAQDLASFAFVAPGTGVGVGLVLNGQLYRGAHHAAAELGDLVVVDGPRNHPGC